MKNSITKTTSQTFKIGEVVEVWVESDSSWECGKIIAINAPLVKVDTELFSVIEVDVSKIR